MDTKYVLANFSSKKKAASNAYRRFMEEGVSMGHSAELTGGGLIRSIGGWSQVLSEKRKGEKTESDERIPGSKVFNSL